MGWQHFDHVVLWDHMTNQNHYIFTTTAPMATKLGRMVTNLEQLLAILLLYPLVTWSCKITWQTKNISPLKQCLRPPNLARCWRTFRGSYPSCGLARSCNIISTIMVPMNTKLGKGVTYNQELLPKKSHDHWATLACDITWQTKANLSPLPQCLWPQNFSNF